MEFGRQLSQKKKGNHEHLFTALKKLYQPLLSLVTTKISINNIKTCLQQFNLSSVIIHP